MDTETAIRSINASLKQAGDDMKKYAADTEECIQGFGARLQAAEQFIVKLETGGGFAGSISGADHSPVAAQFTQALTESTAFQSLSDWNVGTCRAKVGASLRAALTNEQGGSSGSAYIPSQPERGGIVSPALRPLRLLEALPSRPTDKDAVEFVQLNSTGDADEQILEGDEKAEIDFEGELVRAEIVTIAGHTTASRQVLSDHVALQQAIDQVIRHKLLARLEHQLINGQGGQGKILGLIAQATAFLPTIGTTPADIIGESLTRQADAGYLPGLVVMNPLDWYRIQITKTTDDDEYIFGSPTMPVPPSLWNTAVVRTPAMPEGQALTIDSMHVSVLDREQPSVMLSNSHKDYFTRNLVAILGELRAGLEVRDGFAVYRMDLNAST